MREEAISSWAAPKSSSPPPTPTPAASSAGASSPALQMNVGSIDWLGPGQSSKAGSLSRIGGSQPRTSLSTGAAGSTLGSSQPSCRPWERGDLLRRLSTFKPSNWFGKPKAASSLACARRGWVNIDVDKIECESCEANLTFFSTAPSTAALDDNAVEDFVRQLDAGHRVNCPWRGNGCAESLVQFPPTPALALIGGFKDRCDGLLQFPSLPAVVVSAIELMKSSRGPEIDRLLLHSQSFVAGESNFKAENGSEMETFKVEAFCIYSRAQKLISLCGWEPRWLPNIQDCEEHSAQSARNGGSTGPTRDHGFGEAGPSNKAFSSSTRKEPKKKHEAIRRESKCESRSPLLDCSLCGATVKIWDFLTVPRPARYAPNSVDIPETSKKMALTRGVSAASGISGWVATDGMYKEQMEDHDEATTADEGKSQSNAGLDLSLTMAGGLTSKPLHQMLRPEQYQDVDMGRDLIIGQPAGSEVGDRAASYESRGPSTRKRNLEEGGSTVDRPHVVLQHADSVEGTVVDRDGDEVDGGGEYSAGPSKRSRDSDAYEAYHSSYRRDSFGAGPSHLRGLDVERHARRADNIYQENEQNMGAPSTRDSTHVSSVIAMDTICHHGDDDSMESVENYPGDVDDVHFPSTSMFKNPDLNETSEMNYSNQAQQSTCAVAVRIASEMGGSSTNDGEEVLNTDTATAQGRGVPSFGISGGSVGMGASHEAEIHGNDASVHRTDSGAGDVEPIAEVTENQGQTGEFAADPGLMGDFVPEEMDREDPHGDNQDLMSRSVGRTDSGSKIVGSMKAASSESGEKTINMNNLPQENSAHPSLSCNAIVCSGYEASKEEVTQGVANGIGPPNGQSNYEEPVEFDPIKSHNCYCPWVNGNVAAAGCVSSTSSSSNGAGVALCGWQLTLDALDAFQSVGQIPNQTVESESAASLYKWFVLICCFLIAVVDSTQMGLFYWCSYFYLWLEIARFLNIVWLIQHMEFSISCSVFHLLAKCATLG